MQTHQFLLFLWSNYLRSDRNGITSDLPCTDAAFIRSGCKYLQICITVLYILVLGSVFIIVSFTPNNQLRSEGFSKASMEGSVLGAVVNIILGSYFYFGTGYGSRRSRDCNNHRVYCDGRLLCVDIFEKE